MRKIDETVFVAEGARIAGDVVIGKESSIWYNAVLRADNNPITIGEGTNIQDNCVIHVSTKDPCTVGNHVTVGHLALLHGCTVDDNTLIGMGSIVMNGAKIGKNCIVGAGSLVTAGTVIPDNSVAFGRPARVIRQTTPEDTASIMHSANLYCEMGRKNRA